jgi:hypothetical protein
LGSAFLQAEQSAIFSILPSLQNHLYGFPRLLCDTIGILEKGLDKKEATVHLPL